MNPLHQLWHRLQCFLNGHTLTVATRTLDESLIYEAETVHWCRHCHTVTGTGYVPASNDTTTTDTPLDGMHTDPTHDEGHQPPP